MFTPLDLFDTPVEHRTCSNCVRFLSVDQWSGVYEWDNTEQHPNDGCDRWDGE